MTNRTKNVRKLSSRHLTKQPKSCTVVSPLVTSLDELGGRKGRGGRQQSYKSSVTNELSNSSPELHISGK